MARLFWHDQVHQLVIFICSFVNFIIQLCVCLWPTWVTMVPKQKSEIFNVGAMLGLWRQCWRDRPEQFTCANDLPGQDLRIPIENPTNPDEEATPDVFCKYNFRREIYKSIIGTGQPPGADILNLWLSLVIKCTKNLRLKVLT